MRDCRSGTLDACRGRVDTLVVVVWSLDIDVLVTILPFAWEATSLALKGFGDPPSSEEEVIPVLAVSASLLAEAVSTLCILVASLALPIDLLGGCRG